MADDIAIDLDKMQLWTAEQATEFFESGGTIEPPASAPTSSLAASASCQPAVASAAPLGRKPRIVFLHGTACNDQIFRTQLGALMRKLRDAAEVFFIDGALEIEPGNTQAATMRKFFGEKQVLKEYARARTDERGWRTYDKLDEAIQYLESSIASLPGGGGADALFCFSQGSNLATILAARASLGCVGSPPPFRCVVLLSPTLPGYTSGLPHLFNAPLRTPALVGFCKDDPVILTGPTELAKLWSADSYNPMEHSGPGHRPLPATKEELAAASSKILDFLSAHCPQ